jgi:hypothetical protein
MRPLSQFRELLGSRHAFRAAANRGTGRQGATGKSSRGTTNRQISIWILCETQKTSADQAAPQLAQEDVDIMASNQSFNLLAPRCPRCGHAMVIRDPGNRLVPSARGGKPVSVYDKSLYRAACLTPGCSFVLPDPAMRFRMPG